MNEGSNVKERVTQLVVYTDGACYRNQGIGGYAFVVIVPGRKDPLLEVAGGKKSTTNNYMELKAITRAMRHLLDYPWYITDYGTRYTRTRDLKVTIKSDSAYCINAINQGWVYKWQENNWKTKDYKEVKNRELWEKLLFYIGKAKFQLQFEKVKGHSGDKWNELADTLAKEQVERLKAKKA